MHLNIKILAFIMLAKVVLYCYEYIIYTDNIRFFTRPKTGVRSESAIVRIQQNSLRQGIILKTYLTS